MDYLAFAVLPLDEAKSIEKELAKRDVRIKLAHNEKTCTRGCQVTVELLAIREDLMQIQEVLKERFMKALEGHDVNLNTLSEIFDESKAQATCPACGEVFSTTLLMCPECGLNFG